ncbi:hypothetical protein [Brucella pseudogrignonensis]|uniref:Membrane protein n=1 Tax=Brucella pseudogrignonensis TaxID=419475 RepID=A0ABU1MEY2_9HYPH|nr:hypothetical protein [Brucella pseudogrignonensis]MDR6434602.1 putative membrane protein [Brucella pseudogrignonensis]
MGIIVKIIGILSLIPGATIAAFGIATSGTDRLVLLSCGVSLCLTGIIMICLGVLIEHIHDMRENHERLLKLLEGRYKVDSL